MLNIGDAIAIKLEEKNMTQKKLAQLLFIDPRAISRYVNSDALPTLDILSKLCNMLEIDLNHLLEINSTGNASLLINNTDEAKICKTLRTVNE